MRHASRILSWTAAAAVVLLLGLVVVLLAIDPDAYRPALQRQLSEALGRRVSMQRLSFGIALRPTVVARDLRIANPAWASRPDFGSVARTEFAIDLLALWEGRVEIHRIALEGVDVLLERTAAGEGNWVFAPDRGTADAPGPRRWPDIHAALMQDARVGWRTGDGAVQEVHVAKASAVVRPDRPLQLAVEGTWRDTPIRAEVTAKSSLQEALGGTPWEVSIALRGPQAQASIDATMRHPASIDGIDLRFQIEGAKLDALSVLAGRPLPAWGPYRVSAHVRDNAGEVQIGDLALLLDGLPSQPGRIEVSTGGAAFSQTAPSRVALAGKLDDTDFDLDVTTAPLPQLATTGVPLPFTARAALPGFTLDATGTIAPVAAAKLEFDLALQVKGDVLQAVRVFSDSSLSGSLPLALSGRVSRAAQRYRAGGIAGSIAGSTVAGELTLDTAQQPQLGGNLTLGRVDLAALDLPKAAPPRKGAGTTAPAWTRAIDVDLAVRIARLDGVGVPAERLAGRVRIAGGRVRVDDFSGSIARTDLTGSAAVAWNPRRPELDLRLRIPVIDVARLSPEERAPRTADAWLDAPLPWASLARLDGVAQVEVGRIKGARVAVDRVAATVHLRDARMEISPVAAVVATVPMRGRVAVDAGKEPRLTAALDADGVELERLFGALGEGGPVSGRFGPSSFTVDARGATPRALISGARIVWQLPGSSLVLTHLGESIAFDRLTVRTDPAGNTRLDAAGTRDDVAFELQATGGPLGELLEPSRAWPKIEVVLRAKQAGQQLEVSATTGPLQSILRARDVPVRIAARVEGSRLQLAGTIADLRRPASSPLRAELSIDSLARLAQWLPDMPLPDLPLTGSAVMALEPGAVSLRDLTLQAGQSDATGALQVKWKGRAAIDVDLESRLLDVVPWLPADQQLGTEAVAGDWPVPVDRLRAADVVARVRARRLVVPRFDLNDVALDGSLERGLLQVSVGFAEGSTRGELLFDARDAVPQAAVSLSTQDVDPEALKLAGIDTGAEGPRMSVRAMLAGIGETPVALLRSSRGEVLLTAGPGRVQQVASPFVTQTLTRSLLAVLAPGRKPKDHSHLECAAARFDIADGVASSPHGIALRFKYMDILGSGAVNLSTREVLFGFRAVRRRWLSINLLDLSGGVAQIRGTLDRPTVGLDPSGLLLRGGAAWATVGISVLATDLLNQLHRSENPCAAIAAKGKTSLDPLRSLLPRSARGTSPQTRRP